jgi:hypothetical protein
MPDRGESRSAPAAARGRLRDARGRVVSFLDPFDPRLVGRDDVMPAATLRTIRRDLGFGLPAWRRRAYLASVVIFVACIVFLVFWKMARRTGPDAVELVLWPLNLGIFIFGVIMMWRLARRARIRRAVAVLLAHHRCPHCGYDLHDLPRDPSDGATVCPECGCAWRTE